MWFCNEIIDYFLYLFISLINLKLGVKFGAELEHVPHLLSLAKELDLNVVGIRYA